MYVGNRARSSNQLPPFSARHGSNPNGPSCTLYIRISWGFFCAYCYACCSTTSVAGHPMSNGRTRKAGVEFVHCPRQQQADAWVLLCCRLKSNLPGGKRTQSARLPTSVFLIFCFACLFCRLPLSLTSQRGERFLNVCVKRRPGKNTLNGSSVLQSARQSHAHAE